MRARHAATIRRGIALAHAIHELMPYTVGSYIVTADRLPALESQAFYRVLSRLRFSERGANDTQRSHRQSLPQLDQERKNRSADNA